VEEDDRWIVIDGRRWRRTDPSIAEDRRRERGPKWWEREG